MSGSDKNSFEKGLPWKRELPFPGWGACYDIVFEKDFSRLAQELRTLGYEGRKLCIVTDSHVGPLYGGQVKEELEKEGMQTELYTFPAGEENKNLDTVRSLYTFLIEKHFDRKDCLIALGGGVTGDLTGFAAATYSEGLIFVQIPQPFLLRWTAASAENRGGF